MNLLFVIKRSPFISRDLEHILPVAHEGSHVMLVQDAVLAVAKTPENQQWLDRLTSAGIVVYALSEDITARGITRLLEGVEVVDYGGWVDLVERFQPVSC